MNFDAFLFFRLFAWFWRQVRCSERSRGQVREGLVRTVKTRTALLADRVQEGLWRQVRSRPRKSGPKCRRLRRPTCCCWYIVQEDCCKCAMCVKNGGSKLKHFCCMRFVFERYICCSVGRCVEFEGSLREHEQGRRRGIAASRAGGTTATRGARKEREGSLEEGGRGSK